MNSAPSGTPAGSCGPAKTEFWRYLFDAHSIAVIGANNNLGSWGFDALRAAMGVLSTDATRKVYAVNPNVPTIQGLPSQPTVLDIPGELELAIVVVPAPVVPGVLRQCGQKGVKAAVIISAGFGETDEAGARLEQEVLDIAKRAGMRFVGPNCLGHVDTHTRVASTALIHRAKRGPMALISQSGTMGASIVQLATTAGIGLSKFVGTGNEADLRLEDYLEYLATDPDTSVIALYIEGLREGRRFFDLARRISKEKPIIALKTGTTSSSSQAARSHTGALAGSDAIYTAAFRQAGVIRAEDDEELCDVVVGLLNQPLPKGNRVGILTMGGGFGVVTAEACEREGLRIAPLEQRTIERLNTVLPPRWSHANPVDLVGVRMMGEDTTVSSCLRYLMEDRTIDTLISLLPPISMPPPATGADLSAEQLAAMRAQYRRSMAFMSHLVQENDKPLFLLRRFFNLPAAGVAESTAGEKRIPELASPKRVARAIRHLAWYREYLASNDRGTS